MIIVLGATGHVGSAVAGTLLASNEPVTVLTRSEQKAATWRERSAGTSMADIGDPDQLKDVFEKGRRAFLLNPPAAPSTDTDAKERRTAASIVAALVGAGLEQVVVASTCCAQLGQGIGDLGVLHDHEQALMAQPIQP